VIPATPAGASGWLHATAWNRGRNPEMARRSTAVTWANLMMATGLNNLAMKQGVHQVAKHYRGMNFGRC